MKKNLILLLAVLAFGLSVAATQEVGDEQPPCKPHTPTVDPIDPCDEPYMPVVTWDGPCDKNTTWPQAEDGTADITEEEPGSITNLSLFDDDDNATTITINTWPMTFARTTDITISDEGGTEVQFNLPEGKDDTYWKGVDIHNLCLWPVEAGSDNHPPIYLIDQC